MANIEILKQQKKQMKITFDELSLKSKIPKRTLQNIFNGVTENPRIDTMQAIEKALGLSPDFTEEEKVLGLSPNHAVVLSDDDRYRIHLLAEAEEKLGKAYVDGVLKMIELSVQQKKC